MEIANIDGGNVYEFAAVLSLDEIMGIDSGNLSALGAYDEKNGDALGALVAGIYEDFLEIKSIRVVTDCPNQEIAKKLLDIATDMPEDFKLPVYSMNSELAELLSSAGFEEQESDYYYVGGTLGDIIDIPKPKTIRKGTALTTLEALTDKELIGFVIGEHADEFLQFPEKIPSKDRFSAGSIVCKMDGKLDAVILIEELRDFLRITYCHGKSFEGLHMCASVFKDVLQNDYENDVRIKFLACNEEERDNISQILTDAQIQKVRIFKYEP